VTNLLDQLREQRASARASGDEILHRAASEGREPTGDELTAYQAQVLAEREAADALEQERDRQLAEVRAMATRRTGPTLTRADAELARQFRAAIFAKSPQPIEVYAEQLADEWPDDVPEPVYGRAGRVRLHTRDTLKSTATQAMGTDVYGRIVQHIVGDWCPGWERRPAHPSADLTADHVPEVAAGGRPDGRLVVRCRSCNGARSAHLNRRILTAMQVIDPSPAEVSDTLRDDGPAVA
jgi:hypothetical protein